MNKIIDIERFENTVSHGKNYDAKNMMHVFRLLDNENRILQEAVTNHLLKFIYLTKLYE
jgi:hypothetical protein